MSSCENISANGRVPDLLPGGDSAEAVGDFGIGGKFQGGFAEAEVAGLSEGEQHPFEGDPDFGVKFPILFVRSIGGDRLQCPKIGIADDRTRFLVGGEVFGSNEENVICDVRSHGWKLIHLSYLIFIISIDVYSRHAFADFFEKGFGM